MNKKEITEIINILNSQLDWDRGVRDSINNKPLPTTAIESLQRPYDTITDLDKLAQKYNNLLKTVINRLSDLSKDL